VTAAQDRLAAGALAVFCRYGYAASTLRQVADQLGIQAPSVYSLVTNKAALLELVLTPMLDAVDGLLIRVPVGGDVEAQRHWLLTYRQLLETHQDAVRLTIGDLGINQHSRLAGRIKSQHIVLRAVLAGFGGADQAQTAAVIGLLIWPVLWLEVADRGPAETAVAQALALLHPAAAARSQEVRVASFG